MKSRIWFLYKLKKNQNECAQNRNPNARVATVATKAGIDKEASEVGLGAGASTAAACCRAEKAIIATKTASNSSIFIASIVNSWESKQRDRFICLCVFCGVLLWFCDCVIYIYTHGYVLISQLSMDRFSV